MHRSREAVGDEAAWVKRVRTACIASQRPWNELFGGSEAGYLEELLRASRERCMLYPYHLAESLAVHVRRATPFDYYREMIYETMKAEKSFDTIPNFTAADCLRLLRVGRNEFIHGLNVCRSKGWLWKRRRSRYSRDIAEIRYSRDIADAENRTAAYLARQRSRRLARRLAARRLDAARQAVGDVPSHPAL